MANKKLDLEAVSAFIKSCSAATKVYIGCDSERFRLKDKITGKMEWHADYVTVVVVHVDGRHGCRIFPEMVRERVYDQRKDRPRMRLMAEVHKAAEMYLRLEEVLGDHEVEIHLDINPNLMHGSSCAVEEAIGYIKGMCNVIPLVKPNAFAASYAADRAKELGLVRHEPIHDEIVARAAVRRNKKAA